MVKYLRELKIEPQVIHDKDTGVEGMRIFNAPIAAAFGTDKFASWFLTKIGTGHGVPAAIDR